MISQSAASSKNRSGDDEQLSHICMDIDGGHLWAFKYFQHHIGVGGVGISIAYTLVSPRRKCCLRRGSLHPDATIGRTVRWCGNTEARQPPMSLEQNPAQHFSCLPTFVPPATPEGPPASHLFLSSPSFVYISNQPPAAFSPS